jgi:uncharacterized protein YjiS (DUF1127 family)
VGTVVKGALNGAVDTAGRHLARELAPRRVNVVSPGVVDTSLWGEAWSEARNPFIARVAPTLPAGRVGRLEELARAYLFLMTNGFVTGSVLDVDGGRLLGTGVWWLYPPNRSGYVSMLIGRVASWRRQARDRQLLARQDDRMLRDIGIDRATVDRESTTASWRLRNGP